MSTDSSQDSQTVNAVVAAAARAAASSGLSSAIAVETTSSAPEGTLSASWPIAGSIPCRRSRETYEEGDRSDPLTSAPSACDTSARPLIPAPPMPTKWSFLPSKGASLIRAPP